MNKKKQPIKTSYQLIYKGVKYVVEAETLEEANKLLIKKINKNV